MGQAVNTSHGVRAKAGTEMRATPESLFLPAHLATSLTPYLKGQFLASCADPGSCDQMGQIWDES